MRIAKNELLAGIPVLKIRDYFRLLYSGLMTRDGLAERFNLNEKETEGLVGERHVSFDIERKCFKHSPLYGSH